MSDKADERGVDLEAPDLTEVPQAANDSRPVYDRLRDYAARGIDSPETLSLGEIRQVCFALSLYLDQQE